MNGKANSVREAIAAELFGEMDNLVLRIENAARTLQSHESENKTTTAALLAAADNFRGAVTQFSDAATEQLRDTVQRQAHEVVTQTKSELTASMQEAARQAWRTSAMDEADRLSLRLRSMASQIQPLPRWQRLTEAAAGGLVGAGLLLVVLLALGKL